MIADKMVRSAFHPGQERFTPTKAVYIYTDQPETLSLFACGEAADHTFRAGRQDLRMPIEALAVNNFFSSWQQNEGKQDGIALKVRLMNPNRHNIYCRDQSNRREGG